MDEQGNESASGSESPAKLQRVVKKQKMDMEQEVTIGQDCTEAPGAAAAEIEPLDPLALSVVKNEIVKLYNVTNCKSNTVGQYVELVRSKTPSKYLIHDVMPTPDFEDFFRMCGSTIETLELDSYKDKDPSKKDSVLTPNLDMIARTVLNLTPNLVNLTLTLHPLPKNEAPIWSCQSVDFGAVPNLKIAKFIGITADRWSGKTEWKVEYGKLLCKILKSAVSLESLQLENYNLYAPTYPREQHRDFVLHTDRLKTLKLSDPYGNIGFHNTIPTERLQNRNPLILDNFSLHFQHQASDSGSAQFVCDLLDFLETQSSTLKKIEIHADGCDGTWKPIMFPKMDSVKSFTFSAEGYQDEDLFLSDDQEPEEKLKFFDGEERSNFQLNFPNLEHLKLRPHHYSDRGIILLLAHPRANELELNEELLSPEFEFPSRTRLPDLIWRVWPALTKIHIRLTSYPQLDWDFGMDTWLTGIEEKRFDAVRTAIAAEEHIGLEELDKMNRQFKSYHSCITRLVNLREFKLEGRIAEGVRWITDIGGYLGLAAIAPQLTHLEVRMKRELREAREQDGGPAPATASPLSKKCEECIRAVFNTKVGPTGENGGGSGSRALVLEL